MKTVITFGELMLRLSPEVHLRFPQANSFHAYYGGAEANVAIALAQFGIPVSYVTALPTNDLGTAALNAVRQFGIDTKHVVRKDGRLGVYYCETGYSQRASQVIYDRANSVFAQSKPEDYDWDAIFQGASWYYLTGITPALSPILAEMVIFSAKKAKEHGVKVAFDLNYRRSLWPAGEARKFYDTLCPLVDLCFTNLYQTKDIFGLALDPKDPEDPEAHAVAASYLTEHFGISEVAFSTRKSPSANVNAISGYLYANGKLSRAKTYSMDIVDRVGGGDAFGAALLTAKEKGLSAKQAIDCAVAASCLKHSVEGDYLVASWDEVTALAFGTGDTLIKR